MSATSYARPGEYSQQPIASGSNERYYEGSNNMAPRDHSSNLPYYNDAPPTRYPNLERTMAGSPLPHPPFASSNNSSNYPAVDTDSMDEKAEYPSHDDLAEDAARSKQRRRRCIYIPLIALVIIAAVAIPVGVLLSKKQSTDAAARANPLLTNGGSLSGDVAPLGNGTNAVSSVVPVVLGTTTSTRAASATTATSSGFSIRSSVVRAAATAAATVAAAPVQTSTARQLVVFGASYCDDAHPRPAQYGKSLRPAPYFGGRSSDGIVWGEYLAPMIGSAGKSAELRNYAYSGAMVDNSITYAGVPDTKSQFASFVADIKSGLVPALPKGGRTIVIVWIGLNPLMEIYASTFPQRNPVSAATFASKSGAALNAVDNTGAALVQQIASLQASLASLNYDADIMVLPLNPIAQLPFAVYTANGNSQLLSFMKTMTDSYNAVVQAGVAQIGRGAGSNIMAYVDLPTFFRNIVASPSSASLTDVTTSCLVGMTSVCSNPSSHLWWDSIHMTTNMHQRVAALLAPIINQRWAP